MPIQVGDRERFVFVSTSTRLSSLIKTNNSCVAEFLMGEGISMLLYSLSSRHQVHNNPVSSQRHNDSFVVLGSTFILGESKKSSRTKWTLDAIVDVCIFPNFMVASFPELSHRFASTTLGCVRTTAALGLGSYVLAGSPTGGMSHRKRKPAAKQVSASNRGLLLNNLEAHVLI